MKPLQHPGWTRNSRNPDEPCTHEHELTTGGAVIARRIKVSASVANLMAEVAGIGEGAVHA